jgi:type II secretory ATPase GspE/PulE/Tfp pilus assembly ATPase PilB-like protein
MKTQVLLGEILRRKGILTDSEIAFCLHEQKITSERFGQIAERCGFATQQEVMQGLSEQLDLEVVDLYEHEPVADIVELFNTTLCRHNQFFPLHKRDDRLVIATCAPNLDAVRSLVERYSGMEVVLCLASRAKVNQLITEYYDNAGRPLEYQLEREIAGLIADKDAALRLDTMIFALVRMAVQRRATDIHVRPMEHSINIAFRVDGVMLSVLSLDNTFQRLITTIKLMAGMDIAETRRAQDGSFDIKLDDAFYDIRVSTIACAFGENIVMRLLPRNQDIRRIENLGFDRQHMQLVLAMFRRPYGIFLLTGPTGSGKTTTLHAGIMSLDVLNRNILTIEDPIEYKLPIVRQTEVNNKAGYGFAGAIRTFLRHDPDVIVVGEIRDAETAAAALDAAETGHLVLSTMHTNNAIGIVPRLKSLKADTHQLADVLVGALSQRLVRQNCRFCTEQHQADQEQLTFLGQDAPLLLSRGAGCEQCNSTGFLGRIPIYEIVEFTEDLRAAVHAGASLTEMYRTARLGTYVSMYDVARARVLAGITTVEEVRHHVIAPEELR